MNRFTLKLLLFIALWYEIAAEFRIDADSALIWTLAVIFGGRFALRYAAQAAGLLGPFTVGLLLQAVLWMALLWWFAPSLFHALPLVFDGVILVALALIGARCRFLFEEHRRKHGRLVLADHSGLVLAAVFGALFACMLSMRLFGSLLPLLGYALLPGLPLSFGWRMAPLAAPERFDAKTGDAGSFFDAGLSEDR